MLTRRTAPLLAALLLVPLCVAPAAAQQQGYARQPALHRDTIVFVSEGDLWTVAAEGGAAARLTTHPAEESSPAISPDGETVAFVASYEGPAEIYTMPLRGGRPVRHTYGAERGASVSGFAPDGRLLFTSNRDSTLPNLQLFALDPGTGEAQRFPLSEAWQGALTRDASMLVFTRFRHRQHIKRYRGGTAEQLWRFDTRGGQEAVPLTTDYAGTSRTPMLRDGRVYFLSDRDSTMNLWSMTFAGDDLRQHTKHVGFDVLEASLSAGRIAYRLGADIRLLDLETQEDRRVPIELRSDADQARERWDEDPMDRLSSVHLSANGDAVVLTARGQAFVAPVEKGGRIVTLDRKSDVRYRDARFQSETDRVVVLSDESGEVELWSLAADRNADRQQLTHGAHVLRFEPTPSPDGRFVAWYDKDFRLWLLDTQQEGDAARLEIDRGTSGFSGLTWSRAGHRLAYRKTPTSGLPTIRIHDAPTGRTITVSSERFASSSPAFSPDGKWLYFLSDRTFASTVSSPWGDFQPEPHFDKRTGVFFAALMGGLRSPFDADAPRPKERERDGGKRGEPTEERALPEPPPFPEQPFGLYRAPVPAGDYSWLAVTEGALWLGERQRGGGRRGRGRGPGGGRLLALPIEPEPKEPIVIAEGVRSPELAANGKHLLLRKDSTVHVVELGKRPKKLAPEELKKAAVDLAAWRLRFDPREEWKQIFEDAWRLHRDYFYDPGMHGVDWAAMREKYRPLVARVGDRAELNDVIGQMIGELSALHSSASGGDHRDGPEDVDNASLGARIAADGAAGVWRIEEIYRPDPARPELRSPLARPDLALVAGDAIESVDGVPFRQGLAIGALLREKAGQRVQLRLRRAAGGAPFDAMIEAVDLRRESDMRYADWEWRSRERVEKNGGGRLGYIHLRAMGSGDIGQWTREYAPIFDREGLVIDVRHNRGGNIDSWILGRLVRQAWFYWKGRSRPPTWNMHKAFRGHLVVLCDQSTASDGEAFAEGFKRLDLGKAIGVRTWGGEIWLSRRNRQVDGGVASAGETGVYGAEREWLVEGHGVVPDIVVENLPHATFRGADAQLDAAIAHLLQKIEDDPRPVPAPPEYPDKSSSDNRGGAAKRTGTGQKQR